MPGDQRFPKHEHLRLRGDFARVFARRCVAADGTLAVHVVSNGLGHTRLGISVSKRIGNAVRRNAVKRKIREAFRLGKAGLPRSYDVVCVARSGVNRPGCDIAASLRALIAKAVRRAEKPPNA